MTFSADLIDERVWLGSLASAENQLALDALQITHILTIIDFELELDVNDRFIRKHVLVDDIETTDLLIEFNSCYDFIDKALAVNPNNNVLIHCHAGKSKNASFTRNRSSR